MNFAIEIEILKRRIEELSRNSGNFPPITWGTIVGKLRDQADIAKNFRLKLDNNRTVTAEDQAYIKLANGTQAMKNLSEIGGSGGSLEKEHDWVSPYSYCGTAPIPADVRQGVVYALSTQTGTLAVPSPSDVRKNTPTDNTVGTADLSAQDFLDLLSTSPDPIAERLRNVATVQTTGDQITSLS